MTTGTGIAELPRWLWLGAALVLGLAHGSVREWASTHDPLDDYDVLLTDPAQFEHALVTERYGQRLFRDVTVYPHWMRDSRTGNKRLVHLVAGSYWDGQTRVSNGAVQARWDPACFVAPVPYTPTAGGGGAVASGTVLDYLATLKQTRGVEFRYGWWWWAKRPLFTSAVVSVAVVGGIVPTVLNLLAFGTLTRPPRERRPSLWRVRRRRPVRPGASHVAPMPSRAEPSAADVLPGPLGTAVASAPALLPAPDDSPASTQGPAGERHYGAKGDDFYPTELHVAEETPLSE